MNATVEVQENQILIHEDTWNDLLGAKETATFSSVILTADATIRRGGAFVIYREDPGVMRHFHRISEFEEFVRDINQTRIQLGLEPVAS